MGLLSDIKKHLKEAEMKVIKEPGVGTIEEDSNGKKYYVPGATQQGYCFQDIDAYENDRDAVCYICEFMFDDFPEEGIPVDELNKNLQKYIDYGGVSTHNSIIEELKHYWNYIEEPIKPEFLEQAAEFIFDTVDWQSTGALINEVDWDGYTEDATGGEFEDQIVKEAQVKDDIEVVGFNNQFNTTVKQARIDHKNKTFKQGSFKMINDRKLTRKAFYDLLEDLKEKGYKELKESGMSKEEKEARERAKKLGIEPKVRIAKDIDWETDGDKEALKDLPKWVELPDELSAGEVADWLSDEYGYLVNDLDVTWVTADNFNYMMKHMKESQKKPKRKQKSLKEGAGAGYSVSGKIEDATVNSYTVRNQTTDSYGYPSYELDCDIDVTISDVGFESYEYGGNIDFPIDAKITSLDITDNGYGGNDEGPALNKSEIRDALLGVTFDSKLGGGWAHVTFTGKLTGEFDGNVYGDFYVDSFVMNLTQEEVIKHIDEKVSGELDGATYEVMDEDGEFIESFDDEAEAIEYAKAHNCLEVVSTYHYYTLIDPDGSMDDDIESGETVWRKEEEE